MYISLGTLYDRLPQQLSTWTHSHCH